MEIECHPTLNNVPPFWTQIVCRSCSRNRYPLKYMKDRMAKVCDHCYSELQKTRGTHTLSAQFPHVHPDRKQTNGHTTLSLSPALLLHDTGHHDDVFSPIHRDLSHVCLHGTQQPAAAPLQQTSVRRLPEHSSAQPVETSQRNGHLHPGTPRTAHTLSAFPPTSCRQMISADLVWCSTHAHFPIHPSIPVCGGNAP